MPQVAHHAPQHEYPEEGGRRLTCVVYLCQNTEKSKFKEVKFL